MSFFLEFEGKSVEKAVQKACDELKITKEELEHDVVSYGSTGIFGLVGTKKARIRVAVSEPTPEAVSDNITAEQKENSGFFDQAINKTDDLIDVTSGDPEMHAFADDPIVLGRDVLQRIIDLITTDAKISIKEGSGRMMFNVEGGNSAVLIGKRGQTLEAIQYLVEKIVNKHSEERIRLQIDVGDYLESRRANLERLAGRLAEKAKRSGKPATIGQINAHDRRIVHLLLKDDDGVRTQSMGEGFFRKLVIFPKKNFSRKRRSG